MSLIDEALTLPQGTRLYRCALQINPYEYALEHRKGNAAYLKSRTTPPWSGRSQQLAYRWWP